MGREGGEGLNVEARQGMVAWFWRIAFWLRVLGEWCTGVTILRFL